MRTAQPVVAPSYSLQITIPDPDGDTRPPPPSICAQIAAAGRVRNNGITGLWRE
jgi:hypothetical protein